MKQKTVWIEVSTYCIALQLLIQKSKVMLELSKICTLWLDKHIWWDNCSDIIGSTFIYNSFVIIGLKVINKTTCPSNQRPKARDRTKFLVVKVMVMTSQLPQILYYINQNNKTHTTYVFEYFFSTYFFFTFKFWVKNT